LFSLRLNRLPGQVSSVEVRAADPFIMGLPLRAEGRFDGIQQDSTYGKQGYGLEVGYRLGGGLQIFGTINREVTRPGQGGIRLVDGRQRIARAAAFFAGLGVRIQRLDRRINPRRGFLVETNFEQGRKERTARVVRREAEAAPDTTIERLLLRQERLQAEGRLYLPLFTRQVLVVGGEVSVLLSDQYDLSDLFRFGGATSLRGYNEEQFKGRFVTRVFTEYRFQIDRSSYAFLFFDLGYHEQPEIVDPDAANVLPQVQGVHPGYGVGFQIGTDLGLINVSLAANPDDPTGIRAHLGLSIGL
ncbi:MAG: BamA/TamA family outer membrane protein, partial [Rhodothermales bacterium]